MSELDLKFELLLWGWRINLLTICYYAGQGSPSIAVLGIYQETIGYDHYFSLERRLLGYNFAERDDYFQHKPLPKGSGYYHAIDFCFIEFLIKARRPH